MNYSIIQGDCIDGLKTLPANSVYCCVTSPPYWGLRSYLPAGHDDKHLELGAESTPDAYVARMVEVFREVRRVLRDDGTVWINIASTHSSGIIKSHEYIIRQDLSQKFRREIAQAMSAVWCAHESAESAMQGVLVNRTSEAKQLHHEGLPGLQEAVYSARLATSEILQPVVRKVGKPNKKKASSGSQMPDVRGETRTLPGGHEKEQIKAGVLQQGLLVRVQPAGQSLPVGGGPARANEPGGDKVAPNGDKAGQGALPDMPCEQETRGSSHQAIFDTQSRAVGDQQWRYALPQLPRQVSESRDRTRGNTDVYCERPGNGLENLTFPVSAIPEGFAQFCEPHHKIKPKDDCLIPERLILSLQRDGWYTRQTIIWEKPAPMPESVTDRCTKAHEYIFLLTKSARYFYDAQAIKEEAAEPSRERNDRIGGANGETVRHSPGGMMGASATRNKRSVWTVATQPFSGWTQTCHWARAEPGDACDGMRRTTSQGCPVHDCLGCRDGEHEAPALSRTGSNVDYPVQEPVGGHSSNSKRLGEPNQVNSSDSPAQPCASTANPHSNGTSRTGHAPATSLPCKPSGQTLSGIDGTPTEPELSERHRGNGGSSILGGGCGDSPSSRSLDRTAGTYNEQGVSEALYRSYRENGCTCAFYHKVTKETSHFATFPPKLIEPCILAGSPDRCCPACGKGWERVVERTRKGQVTRAGSTGQQIHPDGQSHDLDAGPSRTVGFRPGCECGRADTVPAVVLDPFLGSGTTIAVAIKHGRAGVGCELNPEYIKLAEDRISKSNDAVALFARERP